MRRYLPQFIFAGALVALLSACVTTETDQNEKPHKFGHNGTDQNGTETVQPKPTPEVTVTAEPTPKVESLDPSVTPVPNPTPMPTPAAQDYPVASPVDGKPGFVTSPYSASGIVDVRGYPPGTEVRDPYSGKIFLVP